ncbi:MAG: DUF2127 domain-containing protein [bacterium]|nr:DUF2127 domain-containing protein [bacterium]
MTKSHDTVRTRLDTGVILIVAFKAFLGLLYVAVGIGAFSLRDRNIEELLLQLVDTISLDRDSHLVESAFKLLPMVTPGLLRNIAIGTLAYGTIEFIQAFGLYYRQLWAEWLIIVFTILLVPVEIYEIVKHATPVKFVVLALNVVIVWYLVKRQRAAEAAHAGNGGALAANPLDFSQN